MSRLGRWRPNRPKLFGPVSDAQEITGTVVATLDNATSAAAGGSFLTVIRNPAMTSVTR